jgi:hypothetical protein
MSILMQTTLSLWPALSVNPKELSGMWTLDAPQTCAHCLLLVIAAPYEHQSQTNGPLHNRGAKIVGERACLGSVDKLGERNISTVSKHVDRFEVFDCSVLELES